MSGKLGRVVGWAAVLLLAFAAPSSAQIADGERKGSLELIEAAREQDRARVGELLEQGADVNQKQPDGATALHWAVYRDDPELVQLLIGAGAEVNATNDLGVLPIVMAASNGSARIVEMLLAAGANANAALESGETALMLASRAGSAAAVSALLARGAKVDAREATRGQTALMWAVANRRPEVTKVLLEAGASVQARSETRTLVFNMGGSRSAGSASRGTPLEEVDLGGSTPLLFAARSGDTESARMLVAKGANVNDTAADGNTALVIAAHSGHGTLAAYLLEQGADAKAAPLGYTALHAAVLRGTLRDRGVKNDDPGAGLPLVKALLDHGADVNAQATKGTPLRRWSHDFALLERWVGATPVWLAAKFLEIDIIPELIRRGADIHIPAGDGTTALMAAAGHGYSRASGTEAFIKDRRDFSSYNSEPFEKATRIPAEEEALVLAALQVLIDAGGDVNRASATGDTAAHAAAALGMNKAIQFLAEHGADLNAANEAGRTPIAVARRDSGVGTSVARDETVELLRKLGAK